jgi:hypothetical protein
MRACPDSGWNDMTRLDSSQVISRVRAELAMNSWKAGIGWASHFVICACQLGHPCAHHGHVPPDRTGIMNYWRDCWDGRWLHLQGDPGAVTCDVLLLPEFKVLVQVSCGRTCASSLSGAGVIILQQLVFRTT